MTDKPHFSLDTWETIKECQYATDKAFWPELYELMEPAPSQLTYVSTLTRFDERGLSKTPPVPPKPSLPLKLAAVLAQYAIRLFECEYCHWPNFPPDSWRPDLRSRIEQRVMDQIEIAERRANGSLGHHGTRDQIRVMIRKGLEQDPLLGIEIPGVAPLIPIPPLPTPSLPPQSLKDRMERAAAIIGIKSFCAAAKISEASYHKVRHQTAGAKVMTKVETYLSSSELHKTT